MDVDRRLIFSDIPEYPQMPVGLLSKLHKSGFAHFGFARIRGYQPELRDLGTVLIRSTGDYARKLAAYAVGYLEDAKLDDFETVVQTELERAESGQFIESLFAQSTVEDLVFSVVRLIKDERQSDVGRQFLVRIVEDVAEDRQYWNMSNYAIASLMHVDKGTYGPLFQKWADKWTEVDPPGDERRWSGGITDGLTGQIFDMLSREEERAAELQLNAEELRTLDGLVTVTRH